MPCDPLKHAAQCIASARTPGSVPNRQRCRQRCKHKHPLLWRGPFLEASQPPVSGSACFPRLDLPARILCHFLAWPAVPAGWLAALRTGPTRYKPCAHAHGACRPRMHAPMTGEPHAAAARRQRWHRLPRLSAGAARHKTAAASGRLPFRTFLCVVACFRSPPGLAPPTNTCPTHGRLTAPAAASAQRALCHHPCRPLTSVLQLFAPASFFGWVNYMASLSPRQQASSAVRFRRIEGVRSGGAGWPSAAAPRGASRDATDGSPPPARAI
jgi:hypothetical protein